MSVCVVDVIFEIVYENVLFVIIVYLCFIYLKLKILYNVINIMKNYFMMLFFYVNNERDYMLICR